MVLSSAEVSSMTWPFELFLLCARLVLSSILILLANKQLSKKLQLVRNLLYYVQLLPMILCETHSIKFNLNQSWLPCYFSSFACHTVVCLRCSRARSGHEVSLLVGHWFRKLLLISLSISFQMQLWNRSMLMDAAKNGPVWLETTVRSNSIVEYWA